MKAARSKRSASPRGETTDGEQGAKILPTAPKTRKTGKTKMSADG